MQARVYLNRSIRWLGVCLVSALFTVTSLVLADPVAKKTFVFAQGDGKSDVTEDVDVSIKFDKLIAVKDIQGKELVLSGDKVDGIMTDSKTYCVGKNYNGNVRLKITGDDHEHKEFQLVHQTDRQSKIPLTVKVIDEKKQSGTPMVFKHGDEKDITALVPDDNKKTCDETTTTLIVEADSAKIAKKSGTYKTKLHLRFVAL
ncbi:hypothetical protein [Parendozoicomonas sp. Alg238-R29]|uniref:hypothetical protein n=1 Tax=Parendozoicomonas sp. Alg238-R29 TaxID=2993446 RepID=UPI00248DF43B|nr:hypothetical protein [Parendozoicomonas sp. Alg238-R29]